MIYSSYYIFLGSYAQAIAMSIDYYVSIAIAVWIFIIFWCFLDRKGN